MLSSLAVSNYRSLIDLVVALGPLNLVTGPNGSGKSNLYRALRLLAETARGGLVGALAREGGLTSTFWAGPESLSKGMKAGTVEVQGGPRRKPVRLQLGFADDEIGYAISLGLPPPPSPDNPQPSKFALDPEIKKECIWSGTVYRPAGALVERTGPLLKSRQGKRWNVISKHLNGFESMLGQPANAEITPEILHVRERIRGWRFYDSFRVDPESPTRTPQLGTMTPVLDHDGTELAAALQTIIEIGDNEALQTAVNDAFPGTRLAIAVQPDNRFSIELHQEGLLRPLTGAEISDGTLRYLLWIAALMSPRPPPLMVLNEPETSLHPDLLPALGRLIAGASDSSQIWVVSHASRLVATLEQAPDCRSIALAKEMGETVVPDQGMLDEPPWRWPDG